MRSWGVWFIIFAVGSVLLPMVGMQFIVVSWIDMWGPTVGWIIRGAMVLAGIAMIVAGGGSAAPRLDDASAGMSQQPPR